MCISQAQHAVTHAELPPQASNSISHTQIPNRSISTPRCLRLQETSPTTFHSTDQQPPPEGMGHEGNSPHAIQVSECEKAILRGVWDVLVQCMDPRVLTNSFSPPTPRPCHPATEILNSKPYTSVSWSVPASYSKHLRAPQLGCC